MARLLNDPNGCQRSVALSQVAVDSIFVGQGLGPAAARELAKGGLAYALPRMGAPACGLFAAWLALIAYSR